MAGDVAIIGVGLHPFGRHEGVSALEMGVIAANLALGKEMPEAVERAREFVRRGLLLGVEIGKGTSPLNHLGGAPA